MRVAHIALLTSLVFPLGCGLASAQPAAGALPDIRVCPRTIQKTCFIGYVTSASKILVLLSSDDAHPLLGHEAEVASSPGAKEEQTPLQPLDLSKAVGAVVLIDGNGQDRIYGAKLLHTADPLLTALYVSAFLGGPSGEEDTEASPPAGTTAPR
jgi:hypothetical protein